MSLTSAYTEHLRQEKAFNFNRSKALYHLVCQANDHVMRLCYEQAPALEIDQALDTLSALTGIKRRES